MVAAAMLASEQTVSKLKQLRLLHFSKELVLNEDPVRLTELLWLISRLQSDSSSPLCRFVAQNFGTTEIDFGIGARAAMLQRVSELDNAVKVTMGPKIAVSNRRKLRWRNFVLLE